ncbi:MAG: hypothetical protein GY822_11505 [Deltaproteobacteria bacterium]|nr:hypothetical protein [Deltaproteobacteria bacterium]
MKKNKSNKAGRILFVGVLFAANFACAPTANEVAGTSPNDAGSTEPDVADDAGGNPEPGPPPIDAGPGEGEPLTTTDDGNGAYETSVVSTGAEWILIDFESGALAAVDVVDDANSLAWDIGFQRFKVKVNGGASGIGDAAVAVIRDATYANVNSVPADGFLQDQPDDDVDGAPEFIMSEDEHHPWYDYDEATHILTANENVYVIRTVEGAYLKMTFSAYYDEASGAAGYPVFS